MASVLEYPDGGGLCENSLNEGERGRKFKAWKESARSVGIRCGFGGGGEVGNRLGGWVGQCLIAFNSEVGGIVRKFPKRSETYP